MTRLEFAQLLGAAPVLSPVTPVTRESALVATQIESRFPDEFMRDFAAAAARGGEVFLCDPRWNETERAQVADLLGGEEQPRSPGAPPVDRRPPHTAGNFAAAAGRGWLMIPTGGTGGRIRFARHDEGTIVAAVGGFTRHFGVGRVNSAGVLPLHHVSGFMAWMRSALTGGEYRAIDWKALESGQAPALPGQPEGWFLSLVPTQLDRLLRQPPLVDWLRGFRTIFLGGGPAWPGLLQRATDAHLPLAPSYGMTETAAMITAVQSHDFMLGERSSGPALPHATVEIGPEGTIRVGGDAVFRGYWPEFRSARWHETEDLGQIDERGHLHVLGRRDDVIISGGEKVDPREVEAVLRSAGGFADVAVIGLPHPEWGREVVAVFPAGAEPDLSRARAALARELAAYKRPKRFLGLADWPRTEAGKLGRAKLEELARRAGA